MPVGRANFDDISAADLENLIQSGVPEGLVIEYKRDPYGNRDADKKEALKDISSFANSAGGHLIIGMEAKNGIPTKLVGLANTNIDELLNRLESLIRDGIEPRIVGVRVRPVTLENGEAAVVVRIPKSWNPPHRVSAANTNRFYLRNSGGVHEASVEELRTLFTRAADAHQQIRDARTKRVSIVLSGRGPIQVVVSEGLLVLHIAPLSAFVGANQIDLQYVRQIRRYFEPLGSMGEPPRFNFDGLLIFRPGDNCHGYTQIFRNGLIEATKSGGVGVNRGERILFVRHIVEPLVTGIASYLDGLRILNVPPPIVVLVALHGVAGAKLGVSDFEYRREDIAPLPTDDPLLLPEIIIDDYGNASDYARQLKPVFDTLWNASGFSRCPYYDADGNWAPPP